MTKKCKECDGPLITIAIQYRCVACGHVGVEDVVANRS